MKKLLPALVALVCLAGCSKWRPKEYGNPFEVLPTNVWEFQEHLFLPNANPDNDCRIPKYVVFRDDGTGYYYYPNSCHTPKLDTLKFTWKYDPDRMRLYYHFRNGPVIGYMTAECQLVGCDYDIVSITSRTESYSHYSDTKRLIDGVFRPKSE